MKANSEIRSHYFNDSYVIVNLANHKKPTDFVTEKVQSTGGNCPFCPVTDTEMNDNDNYSEYTNDNQWTVRSIPNLFPFIEGQDVIIDTPKHGISIADLDDNEVNALMRAYIARVKFHIDDNEYVSLFKNYGKEAGCSLSHSHSQVVPIPIVPPTIQSELDMITDDVCPYCDIVNLESNNIRIVIENDDWVVFTSYCPTADYEMWMIPKSHISNIMQVEDIGLMGTTLRDALIKLKTLIGDPAYNIVFNQCKDGYHLNIRIIPRLSNAAGFEIGTGIRIVTKSPEEAATELKAV